MRIGSDLAALAPTSLGEAPVAMSLGISGVTLDDVLSMDARQ